jgi:hypothetical protein
MIREWFPFHRHAHPIITAARDAFDWMFGPLIDFWSLISWLPWVCAAVCFLGFVVAIGIVLVVAIK